MYALLHTHVFFSFLFFILFSFFLTGVSLFFYFTVASVIVISGMFHSSIDKIILIFTKDSTVENLTRHLISCY